MMELGNLIVVLDKKVEIAIIEPGKRKPIYEGTISEMTGEYYKDMVWSFRKIENISIDEEGMLISLKGDR
ncbi:MAG: hypothetical protein ACRCX8_06700 [Sarcina sp.]